MSSVRLNKMYTSWQFPYVARTIFLILLVAMLASSLFYFLFNSYAPANFSFGGKEVFVYRSQTTLDRLSSFGDDGSGYDERISLIKLYLSDQGYSPKIIEAKELLLLKPADTLFVIDAIALSDEETNFIKEFIKSGGALIFNNYSGFSGSNGVWRGDTFVHNITGLKQDYYINTLEKQAGIFVTPKVFSPLTIMVNTGPLMSFVYYDDIPLFKTPKNLKPDLMLADWTQYNSPLINNIHLPIDFSGVMWHGFKGKGSWVYFSFPSYVFNSSEADTVNFLKLFAGISRYMVEGVAVKVHPYLSGKNPVFISQDTEFRFENAHYFSDVILDLKVPSTSFFVSSLAQEHINVSRELSENPFIEIASHSHTHGPLLNTDPKLADLEVKGSKEILQKLTGSQISGFRPPREEIDDEVAKRLVEAGYKYTMEKNKNNLYPSIIRKDLVVISRVGTDDFAYFAQHTFDSKTIIDKIEQESLFLDALDGIYTLSIHTHLFSNPKNISVVRSALERLQKNDRVDFRQGRDIANRIKTVSKIDVDVSVSNRNYIVSVVNNNPQIVSSATIRLYWPRLGSIKKIISNTTGVDFTSIHNSDARYTDIILSDISPRKQFSLLASY